MQQFSRQTTPNLALIALFCITIAYQLTRALSHPAPVYGGDEYAYLISGQYRLFLPWLWERDPMLQKITNPLFLLLVDLTRRVSSDPTTTLRLWAALSYCAVIGLGSFFVLRKAGIAAALGSLLVLGTLPSSGYSSGFLADLFFYCILIGTVLVSAALVPGRPRFGAVIAGIGLALAFLVKPHTAAAILPTILTLGTLTIFVILRNRTLVPILDGAILGAIMLISWYVTLVLFSALFMERVYFDPRYPLGIFYMDISAGLTSVGLKLALQKPLVLLSYTMANLLTVLMVLFPYLLIIALKTYLVFRHYPNVSQDDRRIGILFIWLLFAIPVATGMASFYTFTVGNNSAAEAWRLHARYYAFIYPITIIAALSIANWNQLLNYRVGLRLRGGISGYGILAIGWPLTAITTWLHNKTFQVWFQDNVETFFLFDILRPDGTWNPYVGNWHYVYALLLVGGPLVYLQRLRRIALVTGVLSAAIFLIAITQNTRIQHIHSTAIHFRIATGQIVMDKLAGVGHDKILVAGVSRYGETAHVLYGMTCACHVRQTRLGQAIDASIIPSGVEYVFSVDDVTLVPSATVVLSTRAGTLYKLAAPWGK